VKVTPDTGTPVAPLAGNNPEVVVDVVVMGVGVAVITVKVTVWLVIPDRAAVILVLPTASAVAVPLAEMVAIFVSELVHVTCEDISTPERPSE